MNGTPRRGAGFLAKEDSFGQGAASNDIFYLPVVDMVPQPVVNVALNEALAGSNYQYNDGRVDTIYSNLEIEFKLNENIFPLLLLNKYTIQSTPVMGDTNVIEHVATYNGRNEGASYVFIFRDPDRGDEEYVGFVPTNINWVVESPGYVRVRIIGRANYPTPNSDTPTIVATPEFVSRNWLYDQAIDTASLDTYYLSAFSAEWSYTAPEDTDEIPLGAATRVIGLTGADMFTMQATSLMPDYSIRDAWRDGLTFASLYGAEDTDRIIVGSSTNIHPRIEIDVPAGKVTDWSLVGDNNSNRKQQFTITTIDGIGVPTSPHQITILNNVASY